MHPALRSFRDEVRAIAVPLLAYLGGLAALAVIAADLLSGGAVEAAVEPVRKSAWIAASRPHPAFAVALPELNDKTATYEIFRRTDGARRDILGWTDATGTPVAMIEILRPAAESASFATPRAAIAALAGLAEGQPAQPAGVVATKFGSVQLVGFAPALADDTRACMGFAAPFSHPPVQIAGWLCQDAAQHRGAPQAALRNALVCMLDRLTLLSAGGDIRIAELFARAELRRGLCGANGAVTASRDWLTGLKEPELRGRL